MTISYPAPTGVYKSLRQLIVSTQTKGLKCNRISIPFCKKDWYDPTERIVIDHFDSMSISVCCIYKRKYYEFIFKEGETMFVSDNSIHDSIDAINAMIRALLHNTNKAKSLPVNVLTKEPIVA